MRRAVAVAATVAALGNVFAVPATSTAARQGDAKQHKKLPSARMHARIGICYCPSNSYLCYIPGIGSLYWIPKGCHG